MPFSDVIRSELSIEVGGFCANPECKLLTGYFVPGLTKSAGDGAHIVAESPDWPRGQSPLTSAQRAMASNGVWLCPSCHRKVDIVRPQDYSIERLQQWKADARDWWRQNQGLPLQVAARPDLRPQVARPSPGSLRGAKKFIQAHELLAHGLWQLRGQSPALFERDIPIPEEVEQQIRLMSSSPKLAKSWQDEWSTTFHCDDLELVDYMKDLVRCVDRLHPPPGSLMNGPRRVDFKQSDGLAQAITSYIDVWQAFGQCLHKHDNWGL